jgi:hypothetical protein
MRREGRARGWAAVGAAALVFAVAPLSAPSLAQTDGSADPGRPAARSYKLPAGALIAPGDDPTLTLLYTGNVVGYVDPCG